MRTLTAFIVLVTLAGCSTPTPQPLAASCDPLAVETNAFDAWSLPVVISDPENGGGPDSHGWFDLRIISLPTASVDDVTVTLEWADGPDRPAPVLVRRTIIDTDSIGSLQVGDVVRLWWRAPLLPHGEAHTLQLDETQLVALNGTISWNGPDCSGSESTTFTAAGPVNSVRDTQHSTPDEDGEVSTAANAVGFRQSYLLAQGVQPVSAKATVHLFTPGLDNETGRVTAASLPAVGWRNVDAGTIEVFTAAPDKATAYAQSGAWANDTQTHGLDYVLVVTTITLRLPDGGTVEEWSAFADRPTEWASYWGGAG